MNRSPTVAVIAGLDPIGASGLLADIRALTVSGVRIAPMISAITAQGARSFKTFQPVDPGLLRDQLEIVFSEYAPRALKIGMLGSVALAEMITEFISDKPDLITVLDPIWRTSSGAILGDDALRDTITEKMLPKLTLITPNMEELKWLCCREERKRIGMDRGARMLVEAGCRAVLVKGGHRDVQPTDFLFTERRKYKFPGSRLKGNIRGTGCHMASFITGELALGRPLEAAVRRAKNFVRKLFFNYDTAGGGVMPAWHPGRHRSSE